MSKVLIYKLQNDGSQKVLVVCTFVGEKIYCEGDEKFINYLSREGITDHSQSPPRQIFPTDGKPFLEQLKNNFTSGYLNASEIIEEDIERQ